MKRVIAFALHQPLFIFLGVILFIGAGVIAFKNLPVEALPDVTDTQVQVITLFQGDRKSTRLNSSHVSESRMPSSA